MPISNSRGIIINPDLSKSMLNYSKGVDGKDVKRLDAMKNAIRSLIEQKANENEDLKLGLVPFNR